MRLSSKLLSAALAATALCSVPSLAREMPGLNGTPVVDEADVLSPAQERALVQRLTELNAESGHQIAVATVSTLDGEDVADFANKMFRYWRLGDAKRNDGVLLLVAPKERKNKIEVGYGLEGVLTDSESNRINRSEILARFKKGDLPGGISAGVEAIGAVVNAPAAQPALTAPAPKRSSESSGGGWVWVLLGLLGVGGGTVWVLSAARASRERERLQRIADSKAARDRMAREDLEERTRAREARLAEEAAAQKKRVLENPDYYSPEGRAKRVTKSPSLNPYSGGTVSGRTSASKPNKSNPPRTSKYIPAPTPTPSPSYDDSWSRSSSSSSSSSYSSGSSYDSGSSSSSSSSSFDGGGGSSGGGGDSGSW